jgi:hypothetical protein
MLDIKVFLMLSFKCHKQDIHGIQHIIMIFKTFMVYKR